jgi:hypothetical protein
MADVELGAFTATCSIAAGSVTVTDKAGSSIELATGECAEAIQTVSHGASLLDVAVLPPKVPGYGNFDLAFTATGSFLVGLKGKVGFDKSNQEDLIRIIDVSLNKTTDSMRLRGGPRRGVSGGSTPEPVI